MTNLYNVLQQHLFLTSIVVLLISLCVGSFLNVVIYRLPSNLYRQWRQECEEFLQREPEAEIPFQRFNLAFPASHCPQCHTALRWWHNIPVISFLCLRGQCAFCKQSIAWRYPAIECLCALLSALAFYHFGLTTTGAAALLFTWFSLAMVFIDIDHQLLPDHLTYSLLWLGLLLNCFALFTPLTNAVIGAIAGYSSLWLIMYSYKLITGKQGMGHGDFKLFAALGAWLGWAVLPFVIFIAALLGACIGIIHLQRQGKDRHTPIPFGPFLAFAGWIMLLYGDWVIATYQQYFLI